MSLSRFRNFNGMTWPVPCIGLSDLQYLLRYGSPDSVLSMEERLVMAAVICAYEDLIFKPKTRRDQIIRELRMGPNV
jgi:hypothetical protein